MPVNKAIQQIEERLSALQPGTLRYETLEAAKRFKNSWVELGRMLWSVFRHKKFREWGYFTFEAYCAKEIGIRAATAKKLLHSYYFLEKEEPTILKELQDSVPVKLPSPEAVNLLRLLKRKTDVSPEGYQKVRGYLLKEGKEPGEIRQEVRSMLAPSEEPPEALREIRRKAVLKRMIGTLKGIHLELAAANMIPKKLLGEIKSIIQKLEGFA